MDSVHTPDRPDTPDHPGSLDLVCTRDPACIPHPADIRPDRSCSPDLHGTHRSAGNSDAADSLDHNPGADLTGSEEAAGVAVGIPGCKEGEILRTGNRDAGDVPLGNPAAGTVVQGGNFVVGTVPVGILDTEGDHRSGSLGDVEIPTGGRIADEGVVRHVVRLMKACCNLPGERCPGHRAAFLLSGPQR